VVCNLSDQQNEVDILRYLPVGVHEVMCHLGGSLRLWSEPEFSDSGL